MKIVAKISIVLIALLIYPFSGYSSNIFAQEDLTQLTLYVSNTCEHCETLLEELEQKDLTQFVVIKEVSADEYLDEFRNVVDECGVRSAVPLLYDGTQCTQGSFGIKEIVYPEGGLEVEDPTPSYEEQQILSGEEEPEIIVDESSTGEPISETEESSSPTDSLSEVLGSSMNGNGGEPVHISIPTYLIMFIAPALFLAIAYLLLTKMKV